MTTDSKDLAILILVGGKSVRFGSEISLIEFYGKPFIMHQVDTLVHFDEDLFLVAHTETQLAKFKSLDFPRNIGYIVDDLNLLNNEEIRSPVIGIYSGLRRLTELGFNKVLIMSSDAPLIKAEIIDFIIKSSKNYESCIPKWKNGFLEPLLAIYPVEKTYQKASEALINRNFSLTSIIDENWQINYLSVEEHLKPLDKNLTSLININGPVDIEKLIELYSE